MAAHGISVWYSRTKLQGADQWHDEIGAALKRCDWFAVVLSPASIARRWVKYELIYALNEPRYAERIIPVLYKKCDPSKLSWVLQSFQTVDFSRGYEAGCRALLRIWDIR